eukprot:CAMPEP_0194138644 /NCGR_PEP_ID=MMETSP0152-20130528/8393_1 /TAXON_ID=1049557 /ORGANISM="Thalassiothrix antarctica, Strain L6-D1" /LENGTH=414 /DNA_ID=CAMNT_0038836151 /DNA_START=170 /DNA_END=1414 /DNA_ORIENTATION=-
MKNFKSITRQRLVTLLFLSYLIIALLAPDIGQLLIGKRTLSISLGDGDCKWTEADVLPNDAEVDGTLFASYPAAGMRMAWQQTEGLTGIQMRDDFFHLELPKIGLVKTQYPHYEGIWSYASNLNRVILLIRNPRWALPSYHTLINELEYAHTWEMAYNELPDVFTRRAPMDLWIKWRDYRTEGEIELWGNHIDFWMYNGSKYWFDVDFERNGQDPFRFRNETERPWPQDLHCVYDTNCFPRAVISFEHLQHPILGPGELQKIANALRDKEGMNVLEDEAINCIWHETWIKAPAPNNNDRGGPLREAYVFTLDQLTLMATKLEDMIEKYSTGAWTNHPLAIDLVTNFQEYLTEVNDEIAELNANPGPTPAPNPNYFIDLKAWYKSIGKGDRYSKIKVQSMSMWDKVKYLYDDDGV